MRPIISVLCAALLSIATTPCTFAQGETALPFFQLSPSAETNGMGGTSVAVLRTDPLSSVFSPAQTGLRALSAGIRGTSYPYKTEFWLDSPYFGFSHASWAVEGGVLLNDLTELPFRLGIGLAYTKERFEQRGLFEAVLPNGSPMGISFRPYDEASGVTVGVGLEYLAKVGIGYSYRSLYSYFGPWLVGQQTVRGNAEARLPSRDYSGYISVPMIGLAESATNSSLELATGLHPFADLSAGVAFNNYGDRVVYVDDAQSDPLPRIVREGIALAGGLRLHGKEDWEIAAITWSREAEDLLIERYHDGTWKYRSGFGDVSLWHNIIQGKYSGKVGLRAGVQFQLGEFLTLRSGVVSSVLQSFDTGGITLQLAGILKGIALAAGEDAPTWLLFARDHIDAQYHWSEFSGTPTAFDRVQYKAVQLSIRMQPL